MLEDRKLGLFERIWQLFTGKNKTESALRSLVKDLSDSKSGLSEANKELKSEVGHKRIENKELHDEIDSLNQSKGANSKTIADLQQMCNSKDESIEKLGESLDAYRNDAVAKNDKIGELESAVNQYDDSIECLESQITEHKENQRQARRNATLAENRADRYERSHKVLEHLEKLGKYDPLVDEPEDLFEEDEGEPTTADEFNEDIERDEAGIGTDADFVRGVNTEVNEEGTDEKEHKLPF